jgi:hypothetical protein
VNLATAKLTVKAVAWRGQRITSGLTITVNGKTARQGVDYAITGTGKNNKIGRGAIQITGTGRAFTGTVTVAFKILPKTLKVTKLTRGAKRLTARWTASPKAEKITGYQIQYRVKGKAKWSKAKKVAPKRARTTLRKLKTGKSYQVRVRGYKVVDGARYSSAWSAVNTAEKTR